MEYILLIHGMRRGTLNEKLNEFIHNLMGDSNIDYSTAFLESDTKNPYIVIDQLIQNNSTDIKIIPLLIFSASHMLEDIPEILNHFSEKNPNVSIDVAPPVGTHPLMKKFLNKRFDEYSTPGDGLVIIAHGNKRFTEADNELVALSEAVNPNIHPMMIYGQLNYEKLLPDVARQYDRLTIVPLFLFDGYLVNKIKRTIDKMALDIPYVVTPSINFDMILKEIIIDSL